MPVIAIPIAIGAYELLAAGAVATGLAAYGVAKRRDIANGLNNAATAAQDTFRESTLHALPYIIGAATGRSLWRPHVLPAITDSGTLQPLPLPDFADARWLDELTIPALLIQASDLPVSRPLPDLRVLPRADDVPLPPAGGPPEDPLGPLLRALAKVKQVAGRLTAGAQAAAKNPWVQGAAVAYRWYVYGSTAVAAAEISRRMIINNPKQVHGPILYDYIYEPLLGDSTAVRTFLGGHQVMSAETSAGMIAVELAKRIIRTAFAGRFLSTGFVDKFVSQLPSFLSVHGYAAFGNLSFFEHQMTANNTAVQDVDIDRATRTAGFFGFTSIAYFPITAWLINLPTFGRVSFREWWMRWGGEKTPALREWLLSNRGMNWSFAQLWHGVEHLLGPHLAAVVAPHYVPRVRTWLAYAGFATVYRSGTQAMASSPLFEDSNISESLEMTLARNLVSVTMFDPYFYLGARSNSLRSMFGNQIVFMGVIYALNPFFSPFDGKDVAVAEAERSMKAGFAKGDEALKAVVLSKPLTERNFLPPRTDLSNATWAHLIAQFAQDTEQNSVFTEALSRVMKDLLMAKEPGERRVGMALGVMLTHIAHTMPDGVSFSQQTSRWRLSVALKEAGVHLDRAYQDRMLDTPQLLKALEAINHGTQDAPPIVHFPAAL